MSEEKESPPNLVSLVEADTVVAPSEERPALVRGAAAGYDATAGFGPVLAACAMGGLGRGALFFTDSISLGRPEVRSLDEFVTRNAAPPPISDIPPRPKAK